MLLTYIPADRPVAVVPVDLNLEPPLPLWDGQDPNLHKLGIYQFEVEAKELRNAIDLVQLPKLQATTLTVELTKSALRFRTQTKDGLFEATSTMQLPKPADIGYAPVTFDTDAAPLRAWSRLGKEGRLYCKYDSNEKRFSWESEGNTSFRSMSAEIAPPLRRDDEGAIMGRLFTDLFAKGVTVASTFLTGQTKKFAKLDGIGMAGGSIRGGCLRAVSRYASPDLPEALTLTIPKAHSQNLRTILRRIPGEVDVIDVGERICVRGRGVEVCWKKGGAWPLAEDSMLFDRPHVVSCVVDSRKLALELRLASVVSANLRVQFEKQDDGAQITIFAEGKVGRGSSKIRVRVAEMPLETIDVWDLTYNAQDVVKAAEAIRTLSTEIRFIDRGLMFLSIGEKSEERIVVSGVERK